VFDAKRLIGRKFDDIEVQSDIKHFPFKVINKTGKPYMAVEYRGETKEFVSALHDEISPPSDCRDSPLKKFPPWSSSR